MEAFAELEEGLDVVFSGEAYGQVSLGSQPIPPGRFPSVPDRRHSKTLAVNAVQKDHAAIEAIAQEGAMVPGDAGAVVSAEAVERCTEEPPAKKRRCYTARVVSDLKFVPADRSDTLGAVYYNPDDSTKTQAVLSTRVDEGVPLWPVYTLVFKAKTNDSIGNSRWLLFNKRVNWCCQIMHGLGLERKARCLTQTLIY